MERHLILMEDIVLSNLKAIILAAGKGSRISNEIDNIPKSLLEINGKSIIRNTVEILKKRNIDINVCTGFKHQMIEKELQDFEVTYYYNPFYSVCNNIGSLWFAQEVFDTKSQVIIISADVVIDEKILDRILERSLHGLLMLGDKSRVVDGDYFLKVENDVILDFGPMIPMEERSYEYICITVISKECAETFRKRLNKMVEDGRIDDYYENVVFSFIGDSRCSPTCMDITGLKWHEVDQIVDYYTASKKFCEKDSYDEKNN